jgi:hypothetical protein
MTPSSERNVPATIFLTTTSCFTPGHRPGSPYAGI